ncbi:MAG: PIN domain-containing protein [Chloroflexi bacterium]|nr:PIN domain-containing protein [Chloroflexota bacterium]
MTVVLDASAVLAFVQGEEGAGAVESELAGDARCSAANWSEVAQWVLAAGREWPMIRGVLLAGYGIRVEPVLEADAEWAARRWRRRENLSLADRLCMALGERLDADVLTADTAWGSAGRVRQIR